MHYIYNILLKNYQEADQVVKNKWLKANYFRRHYTSYNMI